MKFWVLKFLNNKLTPIPGPLITGASAVSKVISGHFRYFLSEINLSADNKEKVENYLREKNITWEVL